MAGPVSTTVNVTTAGTRVPLSGTSLKVVSFVIQVKPANTGNIYFGASTVSSTVGLVLESASAGVTPPSISVESPNNYDLVDLADFYLDAETNGEGVQLMYWM